MNISAGAVCGTAGQRSGCAGRLSTSLKRRGYSGMVITGVAARVPSRIDRLVYLDAFVPEQGQAAIDFFPESVCRLFQDRVASDGFRIVADNGVLDMWHLDTSEATFALERLWDFSMNCFTQPLREDPRSIQIERAYLACVGPKNSAQPVFATFADRAKRERWRYQELSTGHECQISMPEATATFIANACDMEPKRDRQMAAA